MNSLWGEAFNIDDSKKESSILLQKLSQKKQPLKKEVSINSTLKSKKVSIDEKMEIIKANVYRILGKYTNNTVVIKDKKSFIDYIDAAISNGVIAIDTETNNSLDPLTCKLVGLCIYTPGQKNAYVPINHTDRDSNRLSWQLTEEDVKEQLSRVNNLKTIYHNYKFDRAVILCTCKFDPSLYWDTLTGAQLLNENEKAGLKIQYISKIDPSIEKYSIEHLFQGLLYEIFDPELFALYAATDAYMTYRLYKYQEEQFSLEENAKLYNLFRTVEIPILRVASDMELTGIAIDKDYAKRLSEKWHKKLDDLDKKVAGELTKIQPQIDAWSKTQDANYRPVKNGKTQKSKLEQLQNPISLSSNTQMAILLYDILKSPIIDPENPRGTGEEIIAQMNFPICKLILERRSINVLINTFIDKIPEAVNQKDGRLHGHFNPLGREENNVVTGRFSSSDPNLQNIPSEEYSIRLMFKATDDSIREYEFDNTLKVFADYEILMGDDKWKLAKEVNIGDTLENGEVVIDKKLENNYVFLTIGG